MEKYNKVWGEHDFEKMGWHDCRLYGIEFLKEEFSINFDIDYIFEWKLDESNPERNKFLVAPALLTFRNYIDLEIHIPWGESYDFIISDIIICGGTIPAPNNKVNLTPYEIRLETGYIRFSAVEFKMTLKSEPIEVGSQELGKELRESITGLNV